MAAASVAMAGMDPMVFLEEGDVERRTIYQAIANAAFEIRRRERVDLVVRMIKAINGDKNYGD